MNQRAGSSTRGIPWTRRRASPRRAADAGAQPRAVLRVDRRVGHRPPAVRRWPHQCALPAKSRPPTLPRRHRRSIGSRLETHHVAVPTLRRQRPDRRLGGHDVEPPRRGARSTERRPADNASLTRLDEPRVTSHDVTGARRGPSRRIRFFAEARLLERGTRRLLPYRKRSRSAEPW